MLEWSSGKSCVFVWSVFVLELPLVALVVVLARIADTTVYVPCAMSVSVVARRVVASRYCVMTWSLLSVLLMFA